MQLNLSCPINQLGYGVASTNIFLELVKQGHDVTLWPISSNIQADPKSHSVLMESIEKQDVYPVDAPCVKIWHQHDIASFIGRGPHIGFPIFELDKFSKRERHYISCCDKLFVCSEWAKTVVEERTSQEHVSVVPLGTDRSLFNESVLDGQDLTKHPLFNELYLASRNKFIFLNVGKWEIRKGHDFLIDAFCNSFENSDNVELWLAPTNPFLKPEQTQKWESLYQNSRLGSKIRILPRLTSHSDVAIIMSMADCGIFPARAEGWNLEALEMLSCGKRVIATDYSAHTEFLNHNNASLIPINQLETAFDGIWFHGQGQWANLGNDQLDAAVTLMMKSYKEGKNLINQEGIETAKKFSWKNSVEQLVLSCEME